MRAAFYTLGCKVNQYETELMAEDLQKNGYEIVDEDSSPDVFIINSCTVTAESDRKTRQTVHKYRKKLPNAIIVLTGCMPQAFPEDAKNLTSADIVLGNAANHLLVESINEFMISGERVVKTIKHDKAQVRSTIDRFRGRTKAFLKIEDGCDRFCSYCIIPYARGRVRSKPLDEIANEVKALENSGFKEVVLIGINLSAYGKENGKTLADAVEAVKAAAPNMRIRLGSMEPDQLDDITIERLAKIDTLCPQFHLSLQSGCDNTLKRMNRHYDTAFYRALVNKLRSCFDDCAITTDIMVGFAGETEQDHTDSVAFLREIGFARTHVFAYSRRRGTAADKFDGQIENSVKRRRSKEMIEAAKDCMDSFIDGQLGHIYPVLIENRTKDGVYEGYTPNYTRVFVKTDRNIGGEIVDIRLKKRVDDGAFGELV